MHVQDCIKPTTAKGASGKCLLKKEKKYRFGKSKRSLRMRQKKKTEESRHRLKIEFIIAFIIIIRSGHPFNAF